MFNDYMNFWIYKRLYLVSLHCFTTGGERAKELELNEQSAILKEQMQKERDAAASYQKQLQVS